MQLQTAADHYYDNAPHLIVLEHSRGRVHGNGDGLLMTVWESMRLGELLYLFFTIHLSGYMKVYEAICLYEGHM